jgi:hypothetical protein
MAAQTVIYSSPSFAVFLFSLLSLGYFVRELHRSMRGDGQ